MLISTKDIQTNKILEGLTEELDLSDTQIKEAKQRYRAVGEWLEKDDSKIKTYNPNIYPQGSFRLGTMIKPINEDDEYDLDIVCKLENPPPNISQQKLKEMVGHRIKANKDYESMLEPEGRYCWTIKYAEGTKFQMDIIPSIPDLLRKQLYENVLEEHVYQHAIRITDNEHDYYNSPNSRNWPKSNPIGYAEWFKDQMKVRFQANKQMLAESRKVSAEDIEDFEVKTPLQRSVQILKRHRDIMFGDDTDKPISIIITTLAARAYDNEDNLLEALTNIINDLPNYIEEKWDASLGKRIKWIANPVNPEEENFADKWAENPILEEKFYEWYRAVKSVVSSLRENAIEESYKTFKKSFGERLTNKSYDCNNIEKPVTNDTLSSSNSSQHLLDVSHRQSPPWPLKLVGQVGITAKFRNNNTWERYSSDRTIPKHCDIIFSASTEIHPPFKVYWQVVNTGNDAQKNNGLRGGIFPSNTDGIGGLKQKESTLYKGIHWIECFIVKNGVCKARSGEFLVSIN